jgi:tRNA modification GTPase
MSGQKSLRAPDSGAAAAADTIAAIATAPGRGAVATIRLSGARAFEIAAACLVPWPLIARRATLVTVRPPDSDEIADRGLATTFPAPRSFTGEDVVEVSAHGGVVSPALVLAAFIRAGARPAQPGEFTRRALLMGKLDLLQAEALGDLIDAPTGFMHRTALGQLSGALTVRIAALRDALIEIEALLAYDIDFPEEDDGPLVATRVADAADRVRAEIERLLGTLPAARIGREGAVIVLAGVPNSGKSSLFNALLGETRSIVTEIAGTTRDAVDALVEAEPYPWRLVDTAGLREATEPIERLGVEVSARWLARADVALVCGTSVRERELAATVTAATAAVVVRVRTMSDLVGAEVDPADGAIAVCALNGDGLPALRAAVGQALITRYPAPPPDTPIILRARHETALAHAAREVEHFLDVWQSRAVPAIVAAVHIRAAVHALDALIGAVDVDDVLARLFARFCVGK